MAWHGMAWQRIAGQDRLQFAYAAHVVTGRCRPPHVRGPVCVEPASKVLQHTLCTRRRGRVRSRRTRREIGFSAPARVRPAMVRPRRVACTEKRARVEPQLGFDADLSSAMTDGDGRAAMAEGAGVMALGRRAQHRYTYNRAWFDVLRKMRRRGNSNGLAHLPGSSCPTCTVL